MIFFVLIFDFVYTEYIKKGKYIYDTISIFKRLFQ